MVWEWIINNLKNISRLSGLKVKSWAETSPCNCWIFPLQAELLGNMEGDLERKKPYVGIRLSTQIDIFERMSLWVYDVVLYLYGASLIAQFVKNPPAMQETLVQFLGWDSTLKNGKSYPLQKSGLENSVDCIVHGVAKSQTGLSDSHF